MWRKRACKNEKEKGKTAKWLYWKYIGWYWFTHSSALRPFTRLKLYGPFKCDVTPLGEGINNRVMIPGGLVANFIVISNKIKIKILIFPDFEIFLILKIPNDLVIFKFPLSCSHSQLVLTPTCSLSHFHLIFPCISWPLFMRPKHFPLTCSLPHSPFFSHFISFSCKIKTKVSILRALEEAPNHTKCSWRRSSVFRDS